MVCEWGMSDKLGPLAYGQKQEQVFLGRDMGSNKDYSEQTAYKIDEEVKSIVEEQLQRARDILSANRPLLDKMTEELLLVETLDSKQVNKLIAEFHPDNDPKSKVKAA